MKAVQAQLRSLWDLLRLPAEQQSRFVWAEGDVVDEAMVLSCREEADRLADWVEKVEPVLRTTGEEASKMLGKAFGLLHEATVRREEEVRERVLSEKNGDGLEKRAADMDLLAVPPSRLDQMAQQIAAARASNEDPLAQKLREQREEIKKVQANAEMRARVLSMTHKLEKEAAEKRNGNAEAIKQRLERYEAMLAKGRGLIHQAKTCLLAYLLVPEKVLDDFEERYETLPKHLDHPLESDVRSLQEQIEELEAAVERLQGRCDSDGLVIAFRHLCKKNVWNPAMLPLQMTRGPAALKSSAEEKKDEKEAVIARAQFEYFLERKAIKYTEGGLTFFLQAAGSSNKAFNAGKPLKAEKVVDAFEKVPKAPLNF